MIWQPLSTLPRSGKILLAIYAPTSWTYTIGSAVLQEDDTPRMRENRLRYARAWLHRPPEPPDNINDV